MSWPNTIASEFLIPKFKIPIWKIKTSFNITTRKNKIVKVAKSGKTQKKTVVIIFGMFFINVVLKSGSLLGAFSKSQSNPQAFVLYKSVALPCEGSIVGFSWMAVKDHLPIHYFFPSHKKWLILRVNKNLMKRWACFFVTKKEENENWPSPIGLQPVFRDKMIQRKKSHSTFISYGYPKLSHSKGVFFLIPRPITCCTLLNFNI